MTETLMERLLSSKWLWWERYEDELFALLDSLEILFIPRPPKSSKGTSKELSIIHAMFGDPLLNPKKRPNTAVGVSDVEPPPDSSPRSSRAPSRMAPKRVRLHPVIYPNDQAQVPHAHPHSHVPNSEPVAHSTSSPVPLLSDSQLLPVATPSWSHPFHLPPTIQWQPVNTQHPASPGQAVPSLTHALANTPIARGSISTGSPITPSPSQHRPVSHSISMLDHDTLSSIGSLSTSGTQPILPSYQFHNTFSNDYPSQGSSSSQPHTRCSK
ncbi:hypothetical protein NLI96_g7985 [Meripilus lineatus]|uniref:Uncharacterized protein n=1 Tax=Meripilus lineatus TaxID=2056292 RepID=A0AAD5YGN2_9APHY|nr:hypothetical protein NLI96_g7985 [Physisporinus lineatus]